MSENSSSSSSGVGFFGLLTIAFVVLKLTKVITWSWWLVLLPAYGGLGLWILFILIILILARVIN